MGTLLLLFLGSITVLADEKAKNDGAVTLRIDQFLDKHWKAHGIEPAEAASDAEFLRRVTLDLLGRIPTTEELDRFLADKSDDKRQQLIDQLIHGPEFPLHFGNVLDEMIQGDYAGHEPFVDYLRRSLRERKSWEVVFRDMMLGPWDNDERKPANRFLDKRAKELDRLTSDTARVFFGVDISCARCHDHPLVDDWKQDLFYGMAAFFNRTTGGKGTIGEKTEGEVSFVTRDGAEKTAALMFLSGEVIAEPSGDEQKKQKFSRREQLVDIALENKEFFSRSIVNRMWQYFFGRGLIDPVDQMHSGNDAAVAGLLEWMADDFSASGYDLHRLVRAITSSRAYGLSSRWHHEADIPAARHFAVARLRPLSPKQLAFTLLLATGNASFTTPTDIESRVERYVGVAGVKRIEQYLSVEQQAALLAKSLDPPRPDFQSSAVEALFMSNNSAVQQLLAANENNLTARLTELKESREVVRAAMKSVLGREPTEDELNRLANWLGSDESGASSKHEALIWSLISSAEFRFNH